MPEPSLFSRIVTSGSESPSWSSCMLFLYLILSWHMSSACVCHCSFHSSLPFSLPVMFISLTSYLESETCYGFISQMVYILKRLNKVICSRVFVVNSFSFREMIHFFFLLVCSFETVFFSWQNIFSVTMQFSWKSMSSGSPWPQTDVNLLKNSPYQKWYFPWQKPQLPFHSVVVLSDMVRSWFN